MEPDASASTQQPMAFQYSGSGNELALLMLKNLLLTIITLGIYRAWAKTATRQYIWGHVSFMGDRGAYVGTGNELFKGWIKLFGLLIVLAIIVKVFEFALPLLGLLMLPVYGFIFALATYSGLRYRSSRTLWRQIRFGVDKDRELTNQFLWLYFKGLFFTFITLGMYYPWFKHNVRRFLTDKCRYGSAHFRYDGIGKDYAAVYWTGFLFTVLTLGIYLPWYIRNLEQYRCEHNMFQGYRFSLTLKGGDLLVFGLVGYLGSLLTVGLAIPWIINWGLRLFIQNLHLSGNIDLSDVRAVESDGSAMGDDLVSAYDLDLGF